MTDLRRLKNMIDEDNYPYFEDAYLLTKIAELEADENMESLAKELCILKAGIEEIKLGDITIPSPRKHFLTLANALRDSKSRVVTRADEQ